MTDHNHERTELENGIHLIVGDRAVRASYPLMKQLRPHVSETEYVEQIALQCKFDAYFLAGLYVSGLPVALAGFRLVTSLANGKHLYIDDLVSDESFRSNGYGKRMLDWVSSFGVENGCQSLHLDSGVQRHSAHRFYLRERMDIVCYHFRKPLQYRSLEVPPAALCFSPTRHR